LYEMRAEPSASRLNTVSVLEIDFEANPVIIAAGAHHRVGRADRAAAIWQTHDMLIHHMSQNEGNSAVPRKAGGDLEVLFHRG